MEELDLKKLEEEARQRVHARHNVTADATPAAASHPGRPKERVYSGDLGDTVPGLEDIKAAAQEREENSPSWGKRLLAVAGAVGGLVVATTAAAGIAAASPLLGVAAGLGLMMAGAVGGHYVGEKLIDPYVSKPIKDVKDFSVDKSKGALSMMGDALGYLGKPLLAVTAGLVAAGAASVGLLPVASSVALTAGSMAAFGAMAGENNGGALKGAAVGAVVGVAGGIAAGAIAGMQFMGTSDFGLLSHFGRPPPAMLAEAMGAVSELGLAAKMTAVGATVAVAATAVGAAIGGALNHVRNAAGFIGKYGMDSADIAYRKTMDGIGNAVGMKKEMQPSDVRTPEPQPKHDAAQDVAQKHEAISTRWRDLVGSRKSAVEHAAQKSDDKEHGLG